MTTWQWTPYVIPLIAATLLSGALAAYLLRYRIREARERVGAVILLGGAWWTLTYALELSSTVLRVKVFWAQMQFIGIVLVVTAWFTYSLRYTGRDRWITRRNIALLTVAPVIFLLLVFTNGAHGLMWSDVTLIHQGGALLMVQDFAIGFYVFLFYQIAMVLTGATLLMHMFSLSPKLYRSQTRVLLLASGLVVVVTLIDNSGRPPFPGLDMEPFMFAIVGPLVAWGLLRLRLGDVVPVAHELVINDMGDAVLVLDAKDRVLELNPAFQALIDPPDFEVIGQPVAKVWPAWPGVHTIDGGIPDQELALNNGETERFYDMRISPVSGGPGSPVARAIVLRDVTERKLVETELRSLNEELESRVEARTAALSEAVSQLGREIEERRQAEGELLHRNRELVSLQAATAATTSSLDLSFVLDTVTWEMADLLQVDRCMVYEWKPDEDALLLLAEYSPEAPGPQPRIEIHSLDRHPLRRQVLAERRVGQVSLEQAGVDLAEREHMQKTSAQRALLIPMVFQDRVVGLVELMDGKAGTFADREVSLAQLLANQTAIAIENARLYERAQHEIRERMLAEERMQASLEEKVVLLQEIHHRVKNNLQVISSLLHLQSRGIADDRTLEALQESQNRVRSMALIHEKLYRTQDLSRVDLGEYVESLIAYLARSYAERAGSVDVGISAEQVLLSIDEAMPCGLIVNELVSNALKHGFSDGRQGRIQVTIRADGGNVIHLCVGDNGIGFPSDLDFRHAESLGLQLVNTLVAQLEGTIELDATQGTAFEITFATRPDKSHG